MPLTEEHYAAIIDDIVNGRLDDAAIDAFLMQAVAHLDDAEVLALAKARSRAMPRIVWNAPIVVDKHSLGGVAGNRITLVIVPIVAAHGLTMPKTSSRAITSAAGTADAMQTVARVDLDPQEVRRCVAQASACIVWNGRLNHSLIDDRINARTLALNLQSNRWSVASILSKKYSAGSTHVVVDLPCGPRTKLRTRADAQEIQRLFEQTGAGMGLHVKALITDGAHPIGAGIGPALEARDARRVLSGDPDAPSDLREKSLLMVSHILAWAPGVGSVQAGRKRAQELLDSGAALAAFEQIIDAQGRAASPIDPGRHTHEQCAERDGTVAQVDSLRITAIARQAGAPRDLSAGVDLLCRPGSRVTAGEPLYRIHADTQSGLEAAVRDARRHSGVALLA
ncbi:MAG: thymidine phosphorylase [Bordetella sp.]|uniref:thymidine phosphorylase n=1 Tax=Bordetella sp. TaxID=28081 RepID=UPI003F7B6F93